MGYGDGAYGDGGYKGILSGLNADGTLRPPANRINYLTGICWRLAIKPSQGYGWCYYDNGKHWLWPEPNVKPISVIDRNNHRRYLVLDEITGRFWEHPTRTGPTNSGMVANYEDKETSYAGAEIPCEYIDRAQTGEEKHEIMKHEEGHVYVSPQITSNKGNSDYTASGLRPGFEMDYSVIRDGERVEAATTKDVPEDGDLSFDRKVQGNELQVKINTTTSEHRLTGFDPYYTKIDGAAPRSLRTMSEDDWQREYSLPLFWVSKWPNPILNLATGTAATGSILGTTTGPEGTDSAMIFAATDSLSAAVTGMTGDFAFQFGVRDPILPCTVITLGNLTITLERNGDSIRLVYDDGTDTINQDLSWDGESWIIIKVARRNNDLTISKDGSLLNTSSLTSIINHNGTLIWMDGALGELFDIRLYGNYISDSAMLYYYEDITQNDGKSVLP